MMRKVYIGVLCGCIILSLFAVHHTALAQQPLPDFYSNSRDIFTGNPQAPQGGQGVTGVPRSQAEQLSGAAAAAAANPAANMAEEEGVAGDIASAATSATLAGIMAIIGTVAFLVAQIAAFLLWLAGMFLDIAINLSTSGLSDLVNGTARGAIREAWIIFRDLANIGFVFILLYIAINFILSTDSGGTKKLLSNTILAAMLINFSFFFGALVIDIGNQLAVEIGASITEEIEKGEGESASTFILKQSATLKITDDLGILEMGKKALSQSGGNPLKAYNSVVRSVSEQTIQWGTSMVLQVILLVVLMIVFFIAAFMLIARIIALVLLLITSPIGFVGFVLPYTKNIAKQWWQSLVGHTFFLPLFLLFMLIAFKLINNGVLGIGSIEATGSSTTIFGGSAAGQETFASLAQALLGPLVRFGIVVGLFLAALISAKKLSSMGSDIVTKLSGGITSTVGGTALGIAGFAGRNTVGWGASKLVKSEAIQEKLANRGYGLGNLALKTMAGVAGSSMDVRGSRAFSGVASATGLGGALGDPGGKGGFTQQFKDREKSRMDFANNVLKEKDIKDDDPTVVAARKQLAYDKVGLAQAKKAGLSEEDIIKQEKRVRDAEVALAKAKNPRKAKYAENLITPPTTVGKWTRKALGGDSVSGSHAAGKKIMKEISKSKTDQLLETLIKVEKDQNVQDRVIAKQAAKNNP